MDMKQAIASINRSTDLFVEQTRQLSEAALHWKPAEDKWSVQEVACHLEEVVPYWLNEVETLLRSPGAEWGRGLQHEGRLAAVANAGNRPIDEVLQNLTSYKADVEKVLANVTQQQLQVVSPSRNPRFGTKPLSFVIEHLLVEHLETHVKQIQRNIAQFQETQAGA